MEHSITCQEFQSIGQPDLVCYVQDGPNGCRMKGVLGAILSPMRWNINGQIWTRHIEQLLRRIGTYQQPNNDLMAGGDEIPEGRVVLNQEPEMSLDQ